MSQGSISLYDLIQPDFSQAKAIGWDSAETEHEMQQIRQALEAEIAEFKWSAVKQEIYAQLDKLLDVSLGVVLARAWATSRQISKVIDKQINEKSDDVAIIPILTHKVQSEHNPKLIILLNNVKIGELPLTVKFAFKLTGVLLKIQYGKIQAVLAGKCKGISSLAYQNITLEEKTIATFDLPGQINAIVSHEEKLKKEKINADGVMTELRTIEPYAVSKIAEEEVLTVVSSGVGTKIFLVGVGVLVSLFVIWAAVLLL